MDEKIRLDNRNGRKAEKERTEPVRTMRKERKQLLLAYKFFETDDGKRILADLKKKAPLVTGRINTEAGIDPNVLFVQMGRADVVKYIYEMAGRDPLEERETFAETGE